MHQYFIVFITVEYLCFQSKFPFLFIPPHDYVHENENDHDHENHVHQTHLKYDDEVHAIFILLHVIFILLSLLFLLFLFLPIPFLT